ncbi:MAG TPA: hypothetical protein VLX68_03395 [Chitinivibrionales bacterium]|nr:hypothetical protein [Chitinivibrionales bacterium]
MSYNKKRAFHQLKLASALTPVPAIASGCHVLGRHAAASPVRRGTPSAASVPA